MCSYLSKVLHGRLLQVDEKLDVLFAGRRLTILFSEMRGKNERSLEEGVGGISLSSSPFFRVAKTTKFVTKEIVADSSLADAIPDEFFSPELIKVVKNQLVAPIVHFEKFAVRATRGFIVHGQSGVGKTELVNAILPKIEDFDVFRVKNSEDLSAFVRKKKWF